jgi:hypothetical protein
MDDAVLLPYAEFLALKAAGRMSDEPKQPGRAAFVDAIFDGQVQGEVALWSAWLTLDVLAAPDEELSVPLPFGGVAVMQILSGSGMATVTPGEGDEGYRVRVRGPGPRRIQLTFVTPIIDQEATRRVDFAIPRAAAARVTLKNSSTVELVSTPGGLPAVAQERDGGGTDIVAPAGGRDRIALAWKPGADAAVEGVAARFTVEQRMGLKVSAQEVQARAVLTIDVLAGRVEALTIALTPGVELLNVAGPFVRDWSVENGRAQVRMIHPMRERFVVSLDAQASAPDATAPLAVPRFSVQGAVRDAGMLALAPVERWALWPETVEGLEPVSVLRVDGAESLVGGVLPAQARAYAFARSDWNLTLTRREVPARVRSEATLLYSVTDELARLKTRHQLSIGGRGLFGVTLEVPEGYTLKEAGPPALVTGRRQQGRLVEINFSGEQTEQCIIEMTLERPRKAIDEPLALQPVTVIGADEDSGNMALAAPRALRVSELEASGLEATDVRLMQDEVRSMLTSDLVPVMGYRFFTSSFRAVAAIERQRTRVTCETALLASIMPALIRVDAVLNYTVEFSATDTFQLLVPTAAGDAVNFAGPEIKEKVRAPGGPDDGLTTWTIRLQQRVIGPCRLNVSFEQPLPGGNASQAAKVAVPMVMAAGVARESGTLAIARRENLEVRVAEKSEALQDRDIKELPASLAGGFRGFRYFEPSQVWLNLELVRHEPEKVLGALIRRMHIDTVVSDQREATHDAYFEVQNNSQQYLELNLPEGMQIWQAFVGGRSAGSMTRQSDGVRLVELIRSETRDQAFRVRLILRQTLPGGELGMFGRLGFQPPEPLNIPVLRVTWRLYLPNNFRYMSFAGGMRHESGGGMPWIEPAAEFLLNDLPADVAGGIAADTLVPPQANAPMDYDINETEAEKAARLQGSALEIPIVREGDVFQFSRLSEVGDIRMTYWKRKPLVIVQGSVFLLLLAGLLVRMTRRHSLRDAAALTVTFFVLASLSSGFFGRIFATAFAAGMAAVLLGGLVHLVTLWRPHWGMGNLPPDTPPSPKPDPTPEPSGDDGDDADDADGEGDAFDGAEANAVDPSDEHSDEGEGEDAGDKPERKGRPRGAPRSLKSAKTKIARSPKADDSSKRKG